MEIRLFFSLYFLLFIILNVSELNATVSQQKNVDGVCGKPAQISAYIVRGRNFKRGEFPWMVALLKNLKNPPEFLCAATLISMRHVITGKNQNQIFSSFGDKKRLWVSVNVN